MVPDPRGGTFTTKEHPIQSFLWSDYTATPGTTYTYTVVPMYGQPGALERAKAIKFEITTEKERDAGHGIWFNRGAIAGQGFAEQFENKAPDNVDDPTDREVRWLSRGLLQACLDFIDTVPPGDGLRVAAYEFTYSPVLRALEDALDRGVRVRIVYEDTTTKTGGAGTNEKAIAAALLPAKVGNRKVLYPRRNCKKIPHNKFMVHLVGDTAPTSVWTGSTNFTPSGFLGQTNVGHVVDDAAVAKKYLRVLEAARRGPRPRRHRRRRWR